MMNLIFAQILFKKNKSKGWEFCNGIKIINIDKKLINLNFILYIHFFTKINVEIFQYYKK